LREFAKQKRLLPLLSFHTLILEITRLCAIILIMISPLNDAPIWVDTPTDLQALVTDLLQQKMLAVDTESNSLYAYREQVCLIQFSTEDQDYLVDPLALDDLSPLDEIFSSKKIEKIFHAAEYDIICLKRDFHFDFNNIFDTMQAARILGCENLGLGSLLEEEFGVKLDKHYQRANWGKRPLPQQLKDYARLDTHYLIPLHQRLNEKLKKKERLLLAREDFARVTQVPAGNHENGMGHFWRMVSKFELTQRKIAVLYELYEYRERMAQSMDRPVFKVLSERTLVLLAQIQPRSMEDLFNMQGFSARQAKRHGDGILQAIQRGLQSKPPQRNHRHQPDEEFIELYESLRNWRKQVGRSQGVESDVILPRETLESIARSRPQTLEELQQVMQDVPWRFDHFGKSILKTLKKTETE
jgi:ribonuclease D